MDSTNSMYRDAFYVSRYILQLPKTLYYKSKICKAISNDGYRYYRVLF